MSTIFTTPTTIIQYPEDLNHIAWFEQDNFSNIKTLNGKGTSTVRPLLHISRQPKNDINMKTYYLQATGFNFVNLPQVLSGIACRVTINRGGRIFDDTIQLCFQNNLIGINKTGQSCDPVQIYGGSTDLWDVKNISLSMIQDNSFGVTVRFRSHPSWPHKTTPIINGIELQIF
jgi:hypothetical protein